MHGSMASIVQFDEKRGQASTRQCSPLTSELKDFIDRVIVPILVKEYLAANEVENGLAEAGSGTANFGSSTAAPILRELRP